MGPLGIVLIIVGALVLAAVMFAVGVVYRKRVGEREIGSAEIVWSFYHGKKPLSTAQFGVFWRL